MSNFVDDGSNDYLFQDSLFDDLLNDLVYDDLGGDLVSFPAAEFTFEEPFTNNTANVVVNSINQHEKAEASIPILNQQELSPMFVPGSIPYDSPPIKLNKSHSKTHIVAPRPSLTSSTVTATKRKNKDSDSVQETAQRIKTLTLLPILIFKAFNGGDLQKVREIIKEVSEKNCALKTPALDQDIFGQQNIINLFQAIYDAHPDAVWVAKQCKLNEETNVIQCRVYFAGTRIGTMYRNSSILDMSSSVHYDYLYKRPNSSLLDEMDVNMLSAVEIDAMKELEKLSRNLSVFFKGTLDLEVNEHSDKISRMHFDWTITSFREAEI